MIDAPDPLIETQPGYDRAALRAELETVRDEFLAFVGSLSDDHWTQKSPASAWTVGEAMAHLTWALEQLPKEVVNARRGKGMFNSPKWLADPASYWLTRWGARKATREAIRRRYDTAMDAVLQTLDSVEATAWEHGARFYGHGFYSVADLFHTPANHFAEHTRGLDLPRASVSTGRPGSGGEARRETAPGKRREE